MVFEQSQDGKLGPISCGGEGSGWAMGWKGDWKAGGGGGGQGNINGDQGDGGGEMQRSCVEERRQEIARKGKREFDAQVSEMTLLSCMSTRVPLCE